MVRLADGSFKYIMLLVLSKITVNLNGAKFASSGDNRT